MNILGINAYHGNASAALVCDGKLIAAVEEERFNRVKYAAGFPAAAIRYCLKEAGITLSDIDHVAVPRNPYARLATKLFYAMRMPSFARERAKVISKFTGIPPPSPRPLTATLRNSKPRFIASNTIRLILPAAILSLLLNMPPCFLPMDLGDFASSMWGVGRGNRMHIDGSIAFPHSLGLYYSAVTQYLGFLKFGDEYKVMGLGAYGEAKYTEAFRDIVRFDPNGGEFGFRLGLDYFTHHKTGPEMSWADSDKTPVLGKMFSDAMPKKLGAPARQPDEPLEQRHRDMAASLQARLEEVYLGMLRKLAARTGAKAVCLAGGVAFNCVANGKIFDATPFEQVYVHPAAGDAGLAVGAAYHVWHQTLGKPRSFVMDHAYWGPSYSSTEIRTAIRASATYPRRFHHHRIAGRRAYAPNRGDYCRSQNSRLVPRAGRMGAARARQPQHRSRSAPPGDEGNSEQPHQAPRNFSAFRSLHSRGKNWPMVFQIVSFAFHDSGLLRSSR